MSSFSNLSVTSPTAQLILQPFRRFTYVTAHSPTLLSLLLRHRLFTYVSWRAAYANIFVERSTCKAKRSSPAAKEIENALVSRGQMWPGFRVILFVIEVD